MSATGYGPDGPYADRPGQDLLIQSLTGVPTLTGRDGEWPTAAGLPIAAAQGARLVAIGLLAALFARERTGAGQRVDTCLLNALLDSQCQEAVTYLNGGGVPRRSRSGIAHAFVGAPYGIYKARDGLVAIAQTSLPKLARGLGAPDLEQEFAGRSQFASRDELRERVAAIVATRSTAEWLAALGREDIWCGPVHDYPDVWEDPQIQHNGMVQTVEHPRAGAIKLTGIPLRFSATPGPIRRPPPLLGEHTGEVLAEAGYTAAEIAALRRQGLIGGEEG